MRQSNGGGRHRRGTVRAARHARRCAPVLLAVVLAALTAVSVPAPAGAGPRPAADDPVATTDMQYLLSGEPGAPANYDNDASLGSIYLVDAVTGARQKIDRGWGALLSPDGTQILFEKFRTDYNDLTHPHYDLTTEALDGSDPHVIGDVQAQDGYTWAPDSKGVYLADGDNSVSLVDLATGRSTPANATGGDPAIDPEDGSLWVTALHAYVGPSFGGRVDGELPTSGVARPTFSANGRFVSWLSQNAGEDARYLHTLDLDNGAVTDTAPVGGETATDSPVLQRTDGSGRNFEAYPVAAAGGVAVRTMVQDATGAVEATGAVHTLITAADLTDDNTRYPPSFLGGVVGNYAPPALAADDTFALPSAPGTADYDVLANDQGTTDPSTLTLVDPSDAGVSINDGKLEVVDDGTATTLTAHYRVCASANDPVDSPECNTAAVTLQRVSPPSGGRLQVSVFKSPANHDFDNPFTTSARDGRDITVYPYFSGTGTYKGPSAIGVLLPPDAVFRSMVPLANNGFGACTGISPGQVVPHTGNTFITCSAPGYATPDDHWALTVTMPAPSTGAKAAYFGVYDPNETDTDRHTVSAELSNYAAPTLTLSAPDEPLHPGDQVTVQETVTKTDGLDLPPGGKSALLVDGDITDYPVATTAPGTIDLHFEAGDKGPHRLVAAYRSLTPYLTSRSDPRDAEVSGVDAPDVVPALSHSADFTQGGTGQLVVSAHNKGDLDATLGHLTIRLPDGFSFVSAEDVDPGNQFTCTADSAGTTVDCDPNGAVLPGGGDLPRIGIDVAVADDAAGGTAIAHLSATDDADTDNDTATDQIEVSGTPTPTGTDVGIGVRVTTKDPVIAGKPTTLTATVSNRSDQTVSGLALHVLLATGVTFGDPISLRAGYLVGTRSDLAPCTVTTTGFIQQSQVLSCVSPQGLAAGASAVFVLTVDVPIGQVGATQVLSYEVRPGNGTQAVGTGSYRLRVLPPRRATLQVGITGPPSISAFAQPFVVDVANPGNGPTTKATTVTVPVPAALDVSPEDNPAWTCADDDGSTLVCQYPKAILPGGRAPQLRVDVAAPAGFAPQTLEADVASVDDLGPVEAKAALGLTVTKPLPSVLAVTRTNVAGGAYDLAVSDSGAGASHGTITLSEQLPAGVHATATSRDLTWTCTQTGTRLVCSAAQLLIPSGQTGSAVHVVLHGPGSGSFVVAGFAQDYFGSGPVNSQTIVVPGATTGPPTVSTAARTAHSPLVRGAADVATLELHSVAQSAATSADLPVIAMVLPPGLALAAGSLPPASAPQQSPAAGTAGAMQPITGATASLHCRTDSTARAVVCLDDAVPAGASVTEQDVPITVSPSADGDQHIVTGLVPVTGATADARLGAALATVVRDGVAALGQPSDADVPLTSLTAAAGSAQRLGTLTPSPDGKSTTPTVVKLDGSASTAGGTPVTYGWVQTMGPAVTWQPGTATDAPGTGHPSFPAGALPAGVAAPAAYGVRPAFTAPTLTGPTTLGFRLYLTDGALVSSADTTVVMTPTADRPPVIASVQAYDLTDHPDCATTCTTPLGATTPPAGHRVLVRAAVTDPEDDPIDTTLTVLKPTEVGVTFEAVPGKPAEHVFVWPADAPQLTVSVIATDNHVDPTGKPVRAGDTLVIGPAPTPLGISVSAPTKAAAPGVPIPLTAALVNGSVLDTDVTWKQVSGPDVTFSAQHLPATTFTVADSAKLGDTVVLEADAVRGSGSDASTADATVTVSIVAVPAPVAYVDDVQSLHADQNGTTTLTAHGLGGIGALTYSWTVASGGGTLTGADTATATYHAPGDPGLTRLTLTVRDSRGAATSEPVPIVVGTLPTVDPSSVTPCDAHHVLGQIYDLVAHGRTTLQLGPVTLDLGSLVTPGPTCDPNVTLSVHDASFHLGPLTFTDVNAQIDKSALTVSSATVSVPASWKLGSAVAKDVVVDLSTFDISGDVQWVHDPLPFLATPDSVSAAGTTITLGKDELVLATTARVAGGTVTMNASLGLGSNDDVHVAVALKDAVVFGVHASGHGTLNLHGDDVTGDVEIDLGVRSATGMTVTSSSLIWSSKQFEYKAEAGLFGNRLAVVLDGTFSDDDDYTLSVALDATKSQAFSPAPGLNIDKDAGVSGSFSSVKGVETESVEVDAHGKVWAAGPATIDHLQIKLTNRNAPAYCPPTDAGSDVLVVDGLASLKIGSSTQSFGIRACVADPSGDWRLDTTSAVSAVNAAGDVTLADVSLSAVQTGKDDPDFVLTGSLSTHGVKAKATLALLGGSDDFLVDAQLDLSELGLPADLGPGDLLYATKNIPDLSQIPGLDLAIPTVDDVDPIVGYALDQGFSALTSFDVPKALGDFLDDTIHLPTAPQVLVSVTFGDEIEIKASLDAPGDGLTLFQTDGGTKLALKRISLEISTGGSFGLDAEAALTMPSPGATDGSVSTVALSAGISIELLGVPSITVTLEKTGDVWHDAFGVGGLDLGDIAIQGGIVFSTPPTPQIGFGATITSLPASWRKPLGIVGNEPITFVVNISVKNPIFALTLGTADGKPFLEPLAPISASLGGALAIDDASLIIAPLGGDVGPFHFEPGLHLRFDALVFGVDLDVAADVTPTTGAVHASVKLGSFGFAGITLHQTTFTLDISPDGGAMSFDGGIDLPGKAGVTASVDAKFDSSGIAVKFQADAENIGLSSVLSLDELHVVASGTISDLKPPSLSLAAYGTVHLLGTQLKFGGDLVLGAPFGITGFHFYAGASPFHVGPVLVSGSGCGKITLPAGIPAPPNDGLCVVAGFDPTSSTPVTLGLHGSVSVAGIGVTFDGSLDDTGVALSATIKVASAASVTVDGRLFFGSGLAGVTVPDRTGTLRQVQAGDFTIAGTGQVSLLGFGAQFSVAAGHLGSSEFVHGAAKFDVLGSGVAVQGDFSHDDNGFHWALSGTGHVTVGGYDLVSVTASASSANDSGGLGKLSLSGKLSLGPLTASVSGSYDDTAGGAPRFQVAGDGSLRVLGIGVDAHVSIGNLITHDNPGGDLAVGATVDGDVTSLVHLHASVSFDTAGHLCIAGSASVIGGLATGSVTFCTPGTADPGLHASFSVLGFTLNGDIKAPDDWSFSTEFGPFSGDPGVDAYVVSADVSFYFHLKIGISSKQGVQFDGEGSIAVHGCVIALGCAELFGLTLSVNNTGYDDDTGHHDEVYACASTTLLTKDIKACWGSDRGFMWVDP